MSSALWAMAALALLGVIAALLAWPVKDPDVIVHCRVELPSDHHICEQVLRQTVAGMWHHFVIDEP